MNMNRYSAKKVKLTGERLDAIRCRYLALQLLGETDNCIYRRLGTEYRVSFTTVRDAIMGRGGYLGMRDLTREP